MALALFSGWRTALRELEGFLTSPDPQRVEAGVKIIFAKFLTLLSVPFLLGFAVHFHLRGFRFELLLDVTCLLVNSAAYLLLWDKIRRGAPAREILVAFEAAAVLFLALWGLTHLNIIGIRGQLEYAAWVVAYPPLAMLMLRLRTAVAVVTVYAGAFGAVALGSGLRLEPLSSLDTAGIVVNTVSATFVSIFVMTLFMVVSRLALRSMTEVRRSLEASESRYRTVSEELSGAKKIAEAASRAKTEFLARMSHEIRTPMNAVLGMTELLLRSGLEPRQREYAATVHLSGTSLMHLLDDILDLSRIEANRIEIRAEPFEPAEVVREAQDLFAETARRSGVELAVIVEPGVPGCVVGGRTRIVQILNNLVSNAVRHGGRGTVALRLGSEDDGRTLRFAVEDTGPGIRPEDRDRIFENFSQAGEYATRAREGAGLGLAISRRLTEIMGGAIGVESEPGRGATFFFTVPVLEAEAQPVVGAAAEPGVSRPAEEPLPGPSADPAATPLVLVVEDNRTNQTVALDMLEIIGCRTEIAGDGRAAVDAAGAGHHDLILMDCQMPVMDGYEATARIRRAEDGRARVPIVAVTGHAMTGERERCIAAGMDDYLTKPFRLEDLRAVVERWTSRRAV